MMISKKILFPIVLTFVLTACGGGGSSSNDSTPIEISMNDNVVVPKKEISVESISTVPNDTSMLVDGEIEESNKLIDKVVFIPPSDTTPDGFFMKVSKIEKQVNSTGKVKSKISYTVPELDEVIDELKIEERNMVTDDLKVAQVVIPTSTDISASSPSLKKYYKSNKNVIMAGGKSKAGVMFGNSKGAISVGYVGDKKNNHYKFSFNNLEIWKDKSDSKTLSALIALNGAIELKLKSITPMADIDNKDDKYKLKFDTEFETIINTDITAQGKLDFSLTKLLGENSNLQCGDLKYVEEFGSKKGSHGSMSFSGAKWQDNICLGGIQLTFGAVNVLVGNGKTSKIPLSADIFLTMNNKLEVSAEAKLALSYHQITKTGLNMDIKNSDPKKRLTSYQESYDPDLFKKEGVKKPATLKIVPSGKLKGSLTKQMGVALGLRIANIYPAVVEASGAISLNGEVNALASVDTNGKTVGEVCAKVDFTPKVGIYTAVGLAFKGEVVIDTLFYESKNEADFHTGFYYNYEYKFDKLAGLDTCGTYKGKVSYNITNTLSGLNIKNLNIEDKTKKAKKITFTLHDSTGKVVAESFNKDSAFFNLNSGKYTLYVFIQMESGEKYLDSRLIEIKPVPKNLKIETDDKNYKANISWDKIDGVSEYTICLSDVEIKNGICPSDDYLATTNSNSYEFNGLKQGKPYGVFVYHDVGDLRHSSTVKVFALSQTNVEFPLILDSKTSTHFNLSWTAPTGATKYKLCQSSIDEVTYETAQNCSRLIGGDFFDSIITSSNISFNDDGLGNVLQQDTIYYFRVVAYNDSDEVVGVSSLVSDKLAVSDNTETNLKNGLVAYYKFNGNANDNSENGNNGVLNGGVDCTVQGIDDTACSFDGENDYIYINHNDMLNVTNNYSFSFWVNRKVDDGRQTVLTKGRDCLNSYYFSNGGQSFVVADGDSWCDGKGVGSSFPLNEWHFIVGIINNSIGKTQYYIDGNLIAEETINHYTTTNTYPLIIGRHFTNSDGSGGYTYYFKGELDNLRIYKRVLSQSDITELYNSKK